MAIPDGLALVKMNVDLPFGFHRSLVNRYLYGWLDGGCSKPPEGWLNVEMMEKCLYHCRGFRMGLDSHFTVSGGK